MELSGLDGFVRKVPVERSALEADNKNSQQVKLKKYQKSVGPISLIYRGHEGLETEKTKPDVPAAKLSASLGRSSWFCLCSFLFCFIFSPLGIFSLTFGVLKCLQEVSHCELFPSCFLAYSQLRETLFCYMYICFWVICFNFFIWVIFFDAFGLFIWSHPWSSFYIYEWMVMLLIIWLGILV